MPNGREHQQFHAGLKAFIADGDTLLILQDDEGVWELPGGRTEKSEIHKDLKDILAREVKEELGDKIQYKVGSIFHAWIRKPESLHGRVENIYQKIDFCIFIIGFRCTYKSGDIQLSPEHQNFKWITKEEIDDFEFENTYKDAIKYYFSLF